MGFHENICIFIFFIRVWEVFLIDFGINYHPHEEYAEKNSPEQVVFVVKSLQYYIVMKIESFLCGLFLAEEYDRYALIKTCSGWILFNSTCD